MGQRQQRATEQGAQRERYPVAGATAEARATAALGQRPPVHRRGHILRPWRRSAREIRDRPPQSPGEQIFERQDEALPAWPPRPVRSRRLSHSCRGRLWDHRLSGRSGRRPSRDRHEIRRSTADRPGACRSPLRNWGTPLRYGDDATLRQRHLPLLIIPAFQIWSVPLGAFCLARAAARARSVACSDDAASRLAFCHLFHRSSSPRYSSALKAFASRSLFASRAAISTAAARGTKSPRRFSKRTRVIDRSTADARTLSFPTDRMTPFVPMVS